MIPVFKAYKTDTDKEKNGKWFDFDGVRIKCARAGGSNRKYEQALAEATLKIREEFEGKTLSEDEESEISGRALTFAFAKSVFIDLEFTLDGETYQKGIPNEEGECLDLTLENVVDFFIKLPELFNELFALVGNYKNFRPEEDLKN